MKKEAWLSCIIVTLLALVINGSASTNASPLTISDSCQSHCGRIGVPYPFGIGRDCYRNKWYEIICSNISGRSVPFLNSIQRRVMSISLPESSEFFPTIHVKSPIISSGCFHSRRATSSPLNMTGSPFFFTDGNSLTAVGCNIRASLKNIEPEFMGCESTCDASNFYTGQYPRCSGYKCCQTTIPRDTQAFSAKIESVDRNKTEDRCRVAFLSYQRLSPINITNPESFKTNKYAKVELGWFLDNPVPVVGDTFHCDIVFLGYNFKSNYTICRCQSGFKGNPYLVGGCREIDHCQEQKAKGFNPCGRDTCVSLPGSFRCEVKKTWPIFLGVGLGIGLLFIVAGTWWCYKFIRRRKRMELKRTFFKRNGGLLLQQQLSSTQGNVERTRIFGSKELEKATDKFSEKRILGQGGQGTVYKGMLVDGRIVAVKKSRVVDEDNLEEFINEVVILSQINHRNVVKLLGCCLETEVPMLVYEFIPNGNLFQLLHDQSDEFPMTWKVRLQIAVESAGALSYLHSSASIPVFHRDIKTTNILLDAKYRAKVCDFGTSRSITIDQTHLTTTIQGTIGYVDPEYFQTSQFTEKSDVYSFGVVLVELLTGEKPVCLQRSQEGRILATHFINSMKESKLFDIIDDRIVEKCNKKEVMAVASLARRCLRLSGKKRPTMREASMELERIRSPHNVSKFQIQNEGDTEDVEINVASSRSVAFTDSALDYGAASSSFDVDLLVSRRTW